MRTSAQVTRRGDFAVGVAALLALVLGGCAGASEIPSASQPATDGSTGGAPSAAGDPARAPAGGVVSVRTAEQLESALAGAVPGTIIELSSGVYARKQRWEAASDGTETEPITLRGPADAVLTSSRGITGNYGLWITGDHWRVEGITITEASKGIVLDGSVGTIIDGVTVSEIGEEGVHFRACSSDGVLRNSTIVGTGRKKERFGEGVYVGSANSNWDKYACEGERDATENTLIERNTFRDTSAEGADLKEGTTSGILRDNVFDDTGWSGENSADSAVDAKGNGWLVEGNVVRNASRAFLDAFQTHEVYEDYGTENVFRDNTVEGRIPGFGFGMYPQLDNVVACSNSAPGAELGLLSDGRCVP
ncbi:MAG: hypothetical protein ABWY55_10850 [Microbacterium sp.]